MTRIVWTLFGGLILACSSTPGRTDVGLSPAVETGGGMQAGSAVCLTPKNNAPAFSFTLASFGSGTMDSRCHDMIQRGTAMGFNAITLVPAKVFDGQKIIPDGTADDAEVTRCLDEVWNSDLDLVYQPHLESDSLLYPSHPNVWRADFDFVPGDAYFQLSFAGFFEWLGQHKTEILAGRKRVSIMVSAELEKSTTLHGAQWAQFTQNLRSKLAGLGLANNVRLGFDPNWYPKPGFPAWPLGAAACKGFQSYVSALDYVAPSFYGDWSQMTGPDGVTPAGSSQVDTLKAAMMGRLSYYPDSKCKVPQINPKDFAIGEFGIGGDFAHTEQGQWEMAQAPDFVTKRRAVYSNIIAWAKLQSKPVSDPFPATINLWTGGVFDPVGVNPVASTAADGQIADPVIVKMLQDYRSWRCGSGG